MVIRTSPRKARRVFHCARCGHHLRLGAARCGECHGPTPLVNQGRIWLLVVLLLAGVGAVLVLG